uniref:PH domain-containing protein n=1 Tax=Setaria italica TaxID=4555 RepID=K3Y456_SETIT
MQTHYFQLRSSNDKQKNGDYLLIKTYGQLKKFQQESEQWL